MAKRPKGVDLLSRIPSRNESEIPGLALGDRLLVASTQFLRASSEKGRQTDEVEKLVLYYIALNPKLKSARQIRDLAIHCIERMPSGEERIKFDYLFDAGDPENKEFWIRAGFNKKRTCQHICKIRRRSSRSQKLGSETGSSQNRRKPH